MADESEWEAVPQAAPAPAGATAVPGGAPADESEWEAVPAAASGAPAASGNNSDWLQVLASNPHETLKQSVLKSPFRATEDVLKGAWGLVKNIPKYYEQAKTEIPGIYTTMRDHPAHLGVQMAAGLEDFINKAAQTPLQAAKYGANRLNLLPQGVPNTIEKITPEDTTGAIKDVFGEPKYPGEKLLRGMVANIPGIEVGNRGLAQNLIRGHDVLENKAVKGFNQVATQFTKRGLPPVPVAPNLISNLEQYFPKTEQSATLLNNAMTGDYKALRKVQSQLYTGAKKNLQSQVETERMRGHEMLEHREKINDAISNHLTNLGQDDLNSILNKSRANFKQLKQTYYNPHLPSAIGSLLDKDVQRIPKNMGDILNEDSKPMQNLVNFHPGLSEKIRGHLLRRDLTNLGLKYGIPLSAGALGTYEAMKHLVPGDKEE